MEADERNEASESPPAGRGKSLDLPDGLYFFGGDETCLWIYVLGDGPWKVKVTL